MPGLRRAGVTQGEDPGTPRPRRFFDYATDVDPVMSTFGWKVIGLTYVALVLPVLGAFFPRGAATNWAWFAASAVLAAVVGLLNLVHFRVMTRSDGYREPPAAAVLVEASAGTVAGAMMAYAIGGHTGMYLPLVFVPTLLIAMIGNRAMVAVSWAVATVAVTWVALASGSIDNSALAFVISYGSVWGIASVMVHLLAMTSLHSDSQINGLADAAGIVARAHSLIDGVERILPVIANWANARCVAAYRITAPDNIAEVLGTWPNHGVAVTTGAAPPTEHELHAAARNHGVLYADRRSMIVIEGSEGEHIAIAIDEPPTLRLNALMKHFNLQRMALQLDTLVSRSRYIEQLEKLGRTDGLTELPNRRGLTSRLEQARIDTRRRGGHLSVVMIDLDNFKDFNDSFGHLAGDELLRRFADELKDRLRAIDFVARYGGEEFCMVLPDTDATGADQLLAKLRVTFGNVHELRGVTFSAGIAEWDACEDADALIGRADQALYDAKAAGRDRSIIDRPLR